MTDLVRSPGSIVPAGYLLTTRLLAHCYLDDRDGCRKVEHCHPEHVLFWPDRATAWVEVSDRRWSLTTGQGLWVPAGTPHRASRRPDTHLAATFVVPDAPVVVAEGARPIRTVTPVVVTAALREMLIHLAETAMSRERRLRAQTVCLELVAEETRPTIELTVPRDRRIAAIASRILRDPADDRTLDQWAVVTRQSERTIARGFRDETGLTFTEWRTSVRMARAVQMLGEGLAVGTVSRRVGDATNSAFTAAFRRLTGQLPREFLSRAA